MWIKADGPDISALSGICSCREIGDADSLLLQERGRMRRGTGFVAAVVVSVAGFVTVVLGLPAHAQTGYPPGPGASQSVSETELAPGCQGPLTFPGLLSLPWTVSRLSTAGGQNQGWPQAGAANP